MNLPQIFKKRPQLAMPTAISMAASAIDGLQQLYASDELMAEVAGYLRHYPRSWLYIHPGHPLHPEILKDVTETLPHTPEDSFFFVHSSHRWCLICYKVAVAPFLFRYEFDRGARLHRVVMGRPIRWLGTMILDVKNVLAEQTYLNSEDHVGVLGMSQNMDTVDEGKFIVNKNDPVSKLTGAGLHL